MMDTPCSLSACKICTGCYHSHHERCSQRVTCPDTGAITICRCCGKADR